MREISVGGISPLTPWRLIAENEEILDPCGGRRDLVKHVMRASGNPHARFREDPLRLLRAVRFAAETGFQIEKNTLAAMGDLSIGLRSAAQERIRDELIQDIGVGQTVGPIQSDDQNRPIEGVPSRTCRRVVSSGRIPITGIPF